MVAQKTAAGEGVVLQAWVGRRRMVQVEALKLQQVKTREEARTLGWVSHSATSKATTCKLRQM